MPWDTTSEQNLKQYLKAFLTGDSKYLCDYYDNYYKQFLNDFSKVYDAGFSTPEGFSHDDADAMIEVLTELQSESYRLTDQQRGIVNAIVHRTKAYEVAASNVKKLGDDLNEKKSGSGDFVGHIRGQCERFAIDGDGGALVLSMVPKDQKDKKNACKKENAIKEGLKKNVGKVGWNLGNVREATVHVMNGEVCARLEKLGPQLRQHLQQQRQVQSMQQAQQYPQQTPYYVNDQNYVTPGEMGITTWQSQQPAGPAGEKLSSDNGAYHGSATDLPSADTAPPEYSSTLRRDKELSRSFKEVTQYSPDSTVSTSVDSSAGKELIAPPSHGKQKSCSLFSCFR